MSSDRPLHSLPSVGDIETGVVVRIESYGAFVELNRFANLRGLVHISQLSEQRVESVQDYVALHDSVWVKIIDITQETTPDGSRTRHKLRLSMKGIAQDGTAREQAAHSQAQQQVSAALEQNLQSNIGLALARDPMAATSSSRGNTSRLVLKSDAQKQRTVINGYELVDDTEGEPLIAAAAAAASTETVNDDKLDSSRPMGRGRGSTLPAWMTRQQDDDDRVGETGDRKHKKKKHKSDKRKRKKESSRKHHRHDDRKHSKRRSRENSEDSDFSRERDSRERRHKHRKSKRKHYDNDSDSLDDRGGKKRHLDDEPDERRGDRRRHQRRSYSRSDDEETREDDINFKSVEEAEKLIREIEASRLQR